MVTVTPVRPKLAFKKNIHDQLDQLHPTPAFLPRWIPPRLVNGTTPRKTVTGSSHPPSFHFGRHIPQLGDVARNSHIPHPLQMTGGPELVFRIHLPSCSDPGVQKGTCTPQFSPMLSLLLFSPKWIPNPLQSLKWIPNPPQSPGSPSAISPGSASSSRRGSPR